MKYLFSFTLLLLLLHNLSAQTSVSGLLRDEKKQPLSFATVLLLQSKDSSFIKSALSDDGGRFQFDEVGTGEYLLKATFIGMADVFSSKFEVASKPVASLICSSPRPGQHEVVVVARVGRGGEGRQDRAERGGHHQLDRLGPVNCPRRYRSGQQRARLGKRQERRQNHDRRARRARRQGPVGPSERHAVSDIANIEIISNLSASTTCLGNAGIINIRLKKNKACRPNGNFGG